MCLAKGMHVIGVAVSLVSCTEFMALRFFFFAYDIKSLITSNAAAADKCTRAAGPTRGGKCIDDTATEVLRFYRDETTIWGHEVTSTER